jgi:hypothetical protein
MSAGQRPHPPTPVDAPADVGREHLLGHQLGQVFNILAGRRAVQRVEGDDRAAVPVLTAEKAPGGNVTGREVTSPTATSVP